MLRVQGPKWLFPVVIGVLALAACTSGGEPTPTSEPTPRPTPTPIILFTPAPKPDAQSYLDAGVAFAEQGRYQEAVAEFSEAIRLEPGSVPACTAHAHPLGCLGPARYWDIPPDEQNVKRCGDGKS